MKEYSIFCKLKQDINIDSFEIRLMATSVMEACQKVLIIFENDSLNFEIVEVQKIQEHS